MNIVEFENEQLGAAIRELQDQILRLRATPCPTQTFSCGPAPVSASVRDELDELEAEEPGSPAAHREFGDVFATVLDLGIEHGAPLVSVIEATAARLSARMDVVEAGGTWVEAKAAETD